MPTIRYVECPRDAWQGFQHPIPSAEKRSYLSSLLDAGFDNLDLASFVSPRAVPQMADSELVLAELPRPEQADFVGIIVNERGLERALISNVSSLGFPLSVNETFQQRNARQSLAVAWQVLDSLWADIQAAERDLVVYLSMGFGNPYNEPWQSSDTARAVTRLRNLGIRRIALADTMGTADARRIQAVLKDISDPSDLGLHLHSQPGQWKAPLLSALEQGISWFEGSLGGVGGCPFAADTLVANIPSEEVLPFLHEQGFGLSIDLSQLPPLALSAKTLRTRYA